VAARKTGDLDLQPKELDALGAILDPIVSAVQIIANAAQQIISNSAKLHLVNVVNQIRKPLFCILDVAVLFYRRAINRNADLAVIMLNAHDVAVVVPYLAHPRPLQSQQERLRAIAKPSGLFPKLARYISRG